MFIILVSSAGVLFLFNWLPVVLDIDVDIEVGIGVKGFIFGADNDLGFRRLLNVELSISISLLEFVNTFLIIAWKI